MARTPSKLEDFLTAKDVSRESMSSCLRIVQGDVKDIEVVKQVLVLDGNMVDMVVSGIGEPLECPFPLSRGVPLLKLHFLHPQA